jgi:5'(3')-deoxyribonucleotidase
MAHRGCVAVRLGIDLDGVVANFNRGWMDRYNAEFGTNFTDDLVDNWDAALDLTHFGHPGRFWEWVADTRPTIFRSLTTYPGALEALHRLAQDHEIIILSNKPPWAVSDTFCWIGEQGLPTREVHLLRDKWLVECDIYLDDSPHLLPKLVRHRPGAVICRYARPWNDSVAGTHDIAGWDQFVEFVPG